MFPKRQNLLIAGFTGIPKNVRHVFAPLRSISENLHFQINDFEGKEVQRFSFTLEAEIYEVSFYSITIDGSLLEIGQLIMRNSAYIFLVKAR